MNRTACHCRSCTNGLKLQNLFVEDVGVWSLGFLGVDVYLERHQPFCIPSVHLPRAMQSETVRL